MLLFIDSVIVVRYWSSVFGVGVGLKVDIVYVNSVYDLIVKVSVMVFVVVVFLDVFGSFCWGVYA
jgi:hypothetical protein